MAVANGCMGAEGLASEAGPLLLVEAGGIAAFAALLLSSGLAVARLFAAAGLALVTRGGVGGLKSGACIMGGAESCGESTQRRRLESARLAGVTGMVWTASACTLLPGAAVRKESS